MNAELLPDEPSDLEPEPSEPDDASELDYEDIPCTDDGDGDDSRWEAFIPDDDEWDPEPDAGDFWIGNSSNDRATRRQEGKEEDDFRPDRLVYFAPCLHV